MCDFTVQGLGHFEGMLVLLMVCKSGCDSQSEEGKEQFDDGQGRSHVVVLPKTFVHRDLPTSKQVLDKFLHCHFLSILFTNRRETCNR